MVLCPWTYPGKNTGVDTHFLLQGIFPTQRLNPGVLNCRQIPYPLSQHRSIKVKLGVKTWSTGERNGKPLQYSCLENPMNSMKRQKIGH